MFGSTRNHRRVTSSVAQRDSHIHGIEGSIIETEVEVSIGGGEEVQVPSERRGRDEDREVEQHRRVEPLIGSRDSEVTTEVSEGVGSNSLPENEARESERQQATGRLESNSCSPSSRILQHYLPQSGSACTHTSLPPSSKADSLPTVPSRPDFHPPRPSRTRRPSRSSSSSCLEKKRRRRWSSGSRRF